MKMLSLLVLMSITLEKTFAQSEKESKKAIEEQIRHFADAVDNRNAALLETVLNENFRAVANRFPTAEVTTVLNRETYITLLKAGKIGGEKRRVTIESIDISVYVASAKVIFESEKMKFTSYQTYILNADNVWQLVSDAPYIESKE